MVREAFRRSTLLLAALVAGSPVLAAAAPIMVQSYSMPNGDGQASGGSFNYWDRSYSGSGATTVDGAPLTGGTGDLTDGIVASDFWYTTESTAGTGPYVGWYRPVTPDPTVVFNFASVETIDEIRIHIDNSFVGGVYAPSDIRINGTSYAFTAPSNGTIGTITLTGLGLTGSSLDIQFFQSNGGWTFVSEVSFLGTPGNVVPEPAGWALATLSLGVAGLFARRRARTGPN